jgi:hypothetical protein
LARERKDGPEARNQTTIFSPKHGSSSLSGSASILPDSVLLHAAGLVDYGLQAMLIHVVYAINTLAFEFLEEDDVLFFAP